MFLYSSYQPKDDHYWTNTSPKVHHTTRICTISIQSGPDKAVFFCTAIVVLRYYKNYHFNSINKQYHTLLRHRRGSRCDYVFTYKLWQWDHSGVAYSTVASHCRALSLLFYFITCRVFLFSINLFKKLNYVAAMHTKM